MSTASNNILGSTRRPTNESNHRISPRQRTRRLRPIRNRLSGATHRQARHERSRHHQAGRSAGGRAPRAHGAAGARQQGGADLAAYGSDWRIWEAWAAANDVAAMPADPQRVAEFLSDMTATRKLSTVRRYLASISVSHTLKGYTFERKHPAIKTILRGAARGAPLPRRVRPLLSKQVRALLRDTGRQRCRPARRGPAGPRRGVGLPALRACGPRLGQARHRLGRDRTHRRGCHHHVVLLEDVARR